MSAVFALLIFTLFCAESQIAERTKVFLFIASHVIFVAGDATNLLYSDTSPISQSPQVSFFAIDVNTLSLSNSLIAYLKGCSQKPFERENLVPKIRDEVYS